MALTKQLEKRQSFTLWQWLFSSMGERYPFKEDLGFNPGKCITMEEGIQYLREMAMVGMVYGINMDDNTNSHDEDDRKCTWSMWQRVAWNAPVSYVSTLAGMNWKYNKRPTVDEVASPLWHYEDSLSSSLWACFSDVGKLSQELKQFKDGMSFSPTLETKFHPLEISISTWGRR